MNPLTPVSRSGIIPIPDPFSYATIFGLNPRMWLAADDASTLYSATSGGSLVTADRALVKRWQDRSGNGNHYTTSEGVTLLKSFCNGKDVLHLAGDTVLACSTLPTTLQKTMTVVWIGREAVPVDNAGLIVLGTNYSGNDYDSTTKTVMATGGAANTPEGIIGGFSNGSITSYIPKGPGGGMPWHVYALVTNGTTMRYFVDGVLQDVDSSNISGIPGHDIGSIIGGRFLSGVGISSGYRLKGEIGEVIVLGSVINDDTLANLFSILAARWGLSTPTSVFPALAALAPAPTSCKMRYDFRWNYGVLNANYLPCEHWEQVAYVGDLSTLQAHLTQASSSYQPRYLKYPGTPVLDVLGQLQTGAGGYARVPYHAGMDLAGGAAPPNRWRWNLQFSIALATWKPASDTVLFSRWQTGQEQWQVILRTTGAIRVRIKTASGDSDDDFTYDLSTRFPTPWQRAWVQLSINLDTGAMPTSTRSLILITSINGSGYLQNDVIQGLPSLLPLDSTAPIELGSCLAGQGGNNALMRIYNFYARNDTDYAWNGAGPLVNFYADDAGHLDTGDTCRAGHPVEFGDAYLIRNSGIFFGGTQYFSLAGTTYTGGYTTVVQGKQASDGYLITAATASGPYPFAHYRNIGQSIMYTSAGDRALTSSSLTANPGRIMVIIRTASGISGTMVDGTTQIPTNAAVISGTSYDAFGRRGAEYCKGFIDAFAFWQDPGSDPELSDANIFDWFGSTYTPPAEPTMTTGGTGAWIEQAITTYDDKAWRGTTVDGSSSYMEATFTGPGTVEFRHRTLTEATNDYLDIALNGVSAGTSSGLNAWSSPFRVILPSGSNTVRWSYVKNGSVRTGPDAVFVDLVSRIAGRNLLRYSQDLWNVTPGGDSTKWQNQLCAVISNAVLAPDGTMTGSRLSIASGSTHYFYQSFAVTAQAYCYSAYVKVPATNRHQYLSLKFSDGVTYNKYCVWDVDTMTTVLLDSGMSNATATALGDGWYRLSVSWTYASTYSAANIGLDLCLADASYTFAGTVGDGLYVWGVQVEPGTTPGTYRPTFGTAA